MFLAVFLGSISSFDFIKVSLAPLNSMRHADSIRIKAYQKRETISFFRSAKGLLRFSLHKKMCTMLAVRSSLVKSMAILSSLQVSDA